MTRCDRADCHAGLLVDHFVGAFGVELVDFNLAATVVALAYTRGHVPGKEYCVCSSAALVPISGVPPSDPTRAWEMCGSSSGRRSKSTANRPYGERAGSR